MTEKEFVIQHVFKNFSDMKVDDRWYRDWEEHFNVKWRLNIWRKNESAFGLFLGANLKEGSGQSVQAKYKLCIIDANGEVLHFKNGDRVFEPGKHCNWGWFQFCDWKTVTDKYLIDGNLKVKAHVTILKMIGFPRRSFGEDAKKFSDVALVVKGEKFYVSKLFLSSQSEYFETLLMGPFQESGRPEVELKEIEPNDLQNFLELIYGEPSLDDDTVEGILSIAHMYITKNVLQKCEDFLLKDSEKSRKDKLQLAGRYQLKKLRKTCMNQIKTVADIRSVKASNAEEMDHGILAELFEKILAFYGNSLNRRIQGLRQ